MRILDGKRVSESVRAELKLESADFAKTHRRPPGLAVILVGDDPASRVYVSNKIKACEDVGIKSFHHHLSAKVAQGELEALIAKLNQDSAVDAILVQLPLPAHLDKERALAQIAPEKDADGLTIKNRELLEMGRPRVVPCTPAGVMEILKFYKISVQNKNVVVVGRSAIVGHPMALLLAQAGGFVHVVHSKTAHPREITSKADIIVVAAGKPGLIGRDDLKKGAVVVDVGIHRKPQGLCGDVRFQELEGHAEAATPVPGGVGPMTITMLLKNTLTLAKRSRPPF